MIAAAWTTKKITRTNFTDCREKVISVFNDLLYAIPVPPYARLAHPNEFSMNTIDIANIPVNYPIIIMLHQADTIFGNRLCIDDITFKMTFVSQKITDGHWAYG